MAADIVAKLNAKNIGRSILLPLDIKPEKQGSYHGQTDYATLSTAEKNGGIDFNPENLNMELQKNGNGVIIPQFKGRIPSFDSRYIMLNIINITPTINLPKMLGLQKSDEKSQSLSYNAR